MVSRCRNETLESGVFGVGAILARVRSATRSLGKHSQGMFCLAQAGCFHLPQTQALPTRSMIKSAELL